MIRPVGTPWRSAPMQNGGTVVCEGFTKAAQLGGIDVFRE